MRIMDCKSEICSKIAAQAPSILDYICGECAGHFGKVKEYLSAMGIEYRIDSRIVRGLDYYTRTVFEFVSGEIGAQGTVCGGGRYDGLVEELEGSPTPGLGFAMGLERLCLLLEAQKMDEPCPPRPALYIANIGERGRKKAVELTAGLRRLGIPAESDLVGRGLKAQMKHADKLGARYSMVVGDSEIDGGTAQMKEMATGLTRPVSVENAGELARALEINPSREKREAEEDKRI
jgi:histidyl-tRNA synthetase